jgi:hypothetical protein
MFFTDEKSKNVKKIRLSRAAVNKIFLHAYNLDHKTKRAEILAPGLIWANLNGSSGLKPKGPGFESQIRQSYKCWWYGSKRSGCVMNVSPCGFKVKGFALKFPKNLITN